jgi:predicted ATP-grasp superfamily ATP-dependent carboligase
VQTCALHSTVIGGGDVSLNRDRGKRAERAVAERLNGTRLGTLSGVDVVTDDGTWAIEVKSRKAFVAEKWMKQSIKNAKKGRTPLVVVHVQGKQHSDDLVLIRLKDWEAWMGEISGT